MAIVALVAVGPWMPWLQSLQPMKATIYHCTTSDGRRRDIPAQSAAIAIQECVRLNPGLRVTACYSGLTEDEAASLRQNGIDPLARAGIIDFSDEIPNHEALTEEQADEITRREKLLNRSQGRRTDETEAMEFLANCDTGKLAE